jgi:hypothetical protein
MKHDTTHRGRKAMKSRCKSLWARRAAVAGAALLTALLAGLARPTPAKALVTFSDGIFMNAVVDCDYWSYSLGAVVKYPGSGFVRLPIYSNDTRRWITSPGWTPISNGFISSGWVRWPYGRGSFTFYPQVGRYVNGVWYTGSEPARTCYFI